MTWKLKEVKRNYIALYSDETLWKYVDFVEWIVGKEKREIFHENVINKYCSNIKRERDVTDVTFVDFECKSLGLLVLVINELNYYEDLW